MTLLDEIADELISAQIYENYIAAYCPYHGGKRRSLMVWPDYFKCLSCDEQGAPKRLLSFLNGNSAIIVDEEPEPFRNPWNTWLYDSTIADVCRKAHKSVKNQPSQGQYWKSRGISAKKIVKLKLGWRDGYNLIPVIKEGKIIGGVARAGSEISGPKYITPSRKYQDNASLLYVPSWKRVHKHDVIFLAFGPISAMSLYMVGYASCSPLTGKKVKPEILKDLRKKIVIVPDRYEEVEARKLADKLSWRGSVLELPYTDTILDPNDLLLDNKKLLKKALQKCLAN
jgi:hypothetical protein